MNSINHKQHALDVQLQAIFDFSFLFSLILSNKLLMMFIHFKQSSTIFHSFPFRSPHSIYHFLWMNLIHLISVCPFSMIVHNWAWNCWWNCMPFSFWKSQFKYNLSNEPRTGRTEIDSILPWLRGNHYTGGFSKVRLCHCRSTGLTLAMNPNAMAV